MTPVMALRAALHFVAILAHPTAYTLEQLGRGPVGPTPALVQASFLTPLTRGGLAQRDRLAVDRW